MSEPLATDPFFDAISLVSKPLLLTEKDVAALLQCSVRLLQQWRTDGVQPPTWVALGPKLIRYPAQSLVEWVSSLRSEKPHPIINPTLSPRTPPDVSAPSGAGFDEPVFKGGRRRSRQSSFHSFLTFGLPSDEWLFVCSERKRPRDFIESLLDERDQEDEVTWMRLDAYLERIKTESSADYARIQEEQLNESLREGKEAPEKTRLGDRSIG